MLNDYCHVSLRDPMTANRDGIDLVFLLNS